MRLVQRTLLRTAVAALAALRFSSATGVKRASKRAHLVAAVPGAHRASGVPRRTDVGRRTPPCAGYPTTGPRLHCRLRGRARGSRRTRLLPSGRSACRHRCRAAASFSHFSVWTGLSFWVTGLSVGMTGLSRAGLHLKATYRTCKRGWVARDRLSATYLPLA